jgi:hypothetical protein
MDFTCTDDLIARLPALLREAGCDAVGPPERHVLQRQGLTFDSIECSRGKARAWVSVCTRQGDAQRYVSLVGHFGRLVRVWRWYADFLLRRDIARVLREAGAVELEED